MNLLKLSLLAFLITVQLNANQDLSKKIEELEKRVTKLENNSMPNLSTPIIKNMFSQSLKNKQRRETFEDYNMSNEEKKYFKSIRIFDYKYNEYKYDNSKFLNFKIQNTGNKDIERIRFIVYLLDTNNHPVHEILVNQKKLKQNYIESISEKIYFPSKDWSKKVKIVVDKIILIKEESTNKLLSDQKVFENLNSPNQTTNSDVNKSTPISSWTIKESKSKIDDSPTVVISNKYDNTHHLTLRCKENKTSVYLTTNYLGHDNGKYILRFDKEKTKSYTGSSSTNNKAIFLKSPIKIIKKMLKSKDLIFRYSPYRKGTHTISFKIDDLKNKIQPLRKACRW